MKNRRTASLKIKYLKNGKVTVTRRGRKIFEGRRTSEAEHFITGYREGEAKAAAGVTLADTLAALLTMRRAHEAASK
jgi:hypothetical protein